MDAVNFVNVCDVANIVGGEVRVFGFVGRKQEVFVNGWPYVVGKIVGRLLGVQYDRVGFVGHINHFEIACVDMPCIEGVVVNVAVVYILIVIFADVNGVVRVGMNVKNQCAALPDIATK